MRPRCRAFVATAVLLLPAWAAAETPTVSRSGIEQLQARLDQAVGQVSRPSGGIVVGRAEGARGYHLPGYGAVFVLAPRALPRPRGVYVMEGVPGTVIQFEAAPPPTQEPEAVEGETKPTVHERRFRIRTLGRPAPPDPEQARALAEMEAQVAAFQREAEEMRQEADREFERVMRDLLGQLPPVPPAPPAPAAPVAPVEAPEAPRPVRAPAPPRAPSPPLPPPWRFWFESREARDTRPPEQVVADVRHAVVATLEAHGALVSGLGPDEHLAVAVDFQTGGPFVSDARPTKTLVVRARRKDLDERARGRLSPEELRKRIEVVEY